VTIQRGSRDAEGIGALKLLSAFELPMIPDAAESVSELTRRLADGARASMANPSRLHGLRTEAMFRAVLVALGNFQLLTEVDEGRIYYDDELGPIKQPDYLVVDAEGDRLLVEVKTVPPNPRHLRHSIPAAEFQGLRRYGQLVDAPVAVAHYWSAPNVWTLVDLAHLQPTNGRYELDLTEAVRFNQMARFGDLTVGTVPPLELRVGVEEIGERAPGEDAARLVITDVALLAAGQPLTDDVEQRVAFLLFRYGGWEVDTPADVDPGGRITSFTLKAAPEDAEAIVARQGFAVVGALSSMYSALFNEITLDAETAVRLLDHHTEPGEFGSLIPDDYFERGDHQLKLWVLRLQPADAGEAE
jgi:hypothetical protein